MAIDGVESGTSPDDPRVVSKGRRDRASLHFTAYRKYALTRMRKFPLGRGQNLGSNTTKEAPIGGELP